MLTVIHFIYFSQVKLNFKCLTCFSVKLLGVIGFGIAQLYHTANITGRERMYCLWDAVSFLHTVLVINLSYVMAQTAQARQISALHIAHTQLYILALANILTLACIRYLSPGLITNMLFYAKQWPCIVSLFHSLPLCNIVQSNRTALAQCANQISLSSSFLFPEYRYR